MTHRLPPLAGVAVYAAPERILPPDLLEGAARAAVIIFARGVSAASLAATVASAVIKARFPCSPVCGRHFKGLVLIVLRPVLLSAQNLVKRCLRVAKHRKAFLPVLVEPYSRRNPFRF